MYVLFLASVLNDGHDGCPDGLLDDDLADILVEMAKVQGFQSF